MELSHALTFGRPQRAMHLKSQLRETLASARPANGLRPPSVHTEFMETDWEMEEDEALSGLEDNGYSGQSSPRLSVNSSGQPSMTTLSSYEETQTPRSPAAMGACGLAVERKKQVEGPRGPHLFRASISTCQSAQYQNSLSLSLVAPSSSAADCAVPTDLHRTQLPGRRRRCGPFRFADEEPDLGSAASWAPEMVAQRMLDAGIEATACARFVENDINGAILSTLKFEDLKELGMASFGLRTRVWAEIQAVRKTQPSPPDPETPIEEEPDRAARREVRKRDGDKRTRLDTRQVISPLESVSIVGIEQMMPRPHHCSKGENCKHWRRNKRIVDSFKRDHPFVDVEAGTILVAGDPGNPDTAEAIGPGDDVLRPVSDAMPSVVASSDVMGPASRPPLLRLQEAALAAVRSRDPQDNVRQFLGFQQCQPSGPSELLRMPPFEIVPRDRPTSSLPHPGLRQLPRLTMPVDAPPVPRRQPTSARAPYRFGTPFSDMDVPLTCVSLGPVARDLSQSVPPDMSFRQPILRSASRAIARRPSVRVMPALDENRIVSAVTQQRPPASDSSARHIRSSVTPPPRTVYPWTPTDRPLECAVPPFPSPPEPCSSSTTTSATSPQSPPPVTYAGPMRKRRTKLLRHEWHDGFFTLRGTRLAMHPSPAHAHKTLEYVDIDDYSIACSSAASSSKLNAAFKAVHLSLSSLAPNINKKDAAAFSFQLVPQGEDPRTGLNRAKAAVPQLRRRRMRLSGTVEKTATIDSVLSAAVAPAPEKGAVNGNGKTHHFAVGGRDERIDWMRELMLAKAKKQKGEGIEVRVNGNMI